MRNAEYIGLLLVAVLYEVVRAEEFLKAMFCAVHVRIGCEAQFDG